MITEKDLEILYYITPKKYRTVLDGHGDPMTIVNTEKEFSLEEILLNVPLKDLLSSIIKIFKNKYANPLPIWNSIVNYNIKTEEEISKRKDIKKINFNFKFSVKNDFGTDTQYLENLFIEFMSSFANIKPIVRTALQGKNFNENSSNNNTTFTIHNSPILKIEITNTTFQLFIDKDSFIDYGQ